MEKIFDKIQMFVFKTILIAIQFAWAFLLVGLLSKVAGYIAGVFFALCLMGFMNVKRHARM